MATCVFCRRDMLTVDNCSYNQDYGVTYADGINRPALTFHFQEPSGRCGDCGIVHGNYHHPGCDVERCAKRGKQLISCGCLDDENELERAVH